MKTKSKIKDQPAQRDSGISKLTVGIMGILRSLGILGWKTKSENCPVQQGSKISNLVLTPSPPRPLRLNLLCAQLDSGMSKLVYHLCNLRNLRTNLLSAQRDSGMSKLGLGNIITAEGAEHTEKGIFTMQIKNKVRCFMGGWVNGSMSKMQNVFPQRYSKMILIKEALEG